MFPNSSKKEKFRHEAKFLISLDKAEDLWQQLQLHCLVDPHGTGNLGSYEIASLYYDTPDLRFYRDREESVGYRRKIRLRSYNRSGDSIALFAEIKERHKQYVAKKRIQLARNDLLKTQPSHDTLSLDSVLAVAKESAETKEMAYLHGRFSLVPVVIIRYIRKALIPVSEPSMRITLDTRITAGGHSLPFYAAENERLLLDCAHGVLEVKSNQGVPLWLQAALRQQEVWRVRFSKYALGIDTIYKARGFVAAAESRFNPVALA